MKKRNLGAISRTTIILALVCVVGLSGMVSCGNKTAKKNTGKTTQSLQIQKENPEKTTQKTQVKNDVKTGGTK